MLDLFLASELMALEDFDLTGTTKAQLLPSDSQGFYDKFFTKWLEILKNKQIDVSKLKTEIKQCKYPDNKAVNLPIWFLEERGHDLFNKYLYPIFKDNNEIKRIRNEENGKLRFTSSGSTFNNNTLNEYLIDQIPSKAYFISQDTIDLFKSIK